MLHSDIKQILHEICSNGREDMSFSSLSSVHFSTNCTNVTYVTKCNKIIKQIEIQKHKRNIKYEPDIKYIGLSIAVCFY